MNTPAAVRGWQWPAGVTPVAAAVVALAALLVIVLLARAVGRLANAAAAAAAPAPAPAKPGGRWKLLLLAAVVAVGGVLWERHANATAPAKAAPAPVPAPSPLPVPTVTRTVAPHAAPHLTLPVHLTGGQVVLIFVIAAVVAIVLLGPVLRRSP